jgi:hypothetical protein
MWGSLNARCRGLLLGHAAHLQVIALSLRHCAYNVEMMETERERENSKESGGGKFGLRLRDCLRNERVVA